MKRRDFLKTAAATAVISSFADKLTYAAEGSIPYRTLGHTGEKVSLVGIGGYHLGVPSEEEAISIVRTALDAGVNFLDNCWDYNDGNSEIRMGKALRDGYRKKAFLMTKIDGQTKIAASKQIDESLTVCKPITSTCCNFMRSFARPILTESLDLVEVSKLWWKQKSRARFATSDLPGTKTPTSI